jgi:xanthine dehydrogenase molybdopterin-binding subunit B
MFIQEKCSPSPKGAHQQWITLQTFFANSGENKRAAHVTAYVSSFRSWKIPPSDSDAPEDASATFGQIVGEAFMERVPLLASAGSAPNPDGFPNRTNLDTNWFPYYTYACAWTQVEVDGVSGEIDVLRTELFYDAGGSRNPAIDIGQVEGAYVQGLGNIMTEECEYDFDTGREELGLVSLPKKKKEYQTGRLEQRSIMEYAIPSHRSIPRTMGVHLTWLPGPKVVDGKPVSPKDDRNELERVQPAPGDLTNRARAKTTGEPPLVLAVGAISATREAVRLLKDSLLCEKVAFVPLSTPLTPKNILNAIWGEKSIADMNIPSICEDADTMTGAQQETTTDDDEALPLRKRMRKTK